MKNCYFKDMIVRNSGRFCKHPYFITSPLNLYTDFGSLMSGRTMSANPAMRDGRPHYRDDRGGTPNDANRPTLNSQEG